jgi:hypothetical protein
MWSSALVPPSLSELNINHFVPLLHNSHLVHVSCLSDRDFYFIYLECRDNYASMSETEAEIEPNTSLLDNNKVPKSELKYDPLLDLSKSVFRPSFTQYGS